MAPVMIKRKVLQEIDLLPFDRVASLAVYDWAD